MPGHGITPSLNRLATVRKQGQASARRSGVLVVPVLCCFMSICLVPSCRRRDWLPARLPQALSDVQQGLQNVFEPSALISEGAGLKVLDPPAWAGLLSWFLPRIRRSPCDTKSATRTCWDKDTVE